jgi:DNA-binding transcriptional LysR family regulator
MAQNSLTATLRHLRIADLELFITAARLKSLGKAAKLHHLSQSASSAAIVRVEEAFARPLCTHEKRAFNLTKEGLHILPKAEAWLKNLQDELLSDAVPPIRLATTHAIARVCVPALLPHEAIDVQLMRPDSAYGAVLRDEADVAIVLDNARWEGVKATELGTGSFQLYSRKRRAPKGPVLLPEDQIEVLTLQQRWQDMHAMPLAIKSRLPSWSLIADICSRSYEIGFLPDFLALQSDMRPVVWQPPPSSYRVLALSRTPHPRLSTLFDHLRVVF